MARAEIYNPATNSWSDAGDMHHPRTAHFVTETAGGDMYIGGGGSSPGVDLPGEIWHAGVFTDVPTLPIVSSILVP